MDTNPQTSAHTAGAAGLDRRVSRTVVLSVAVATGILAALTTAAAPTGTGWWDAVLVAAMASVVVIAVAELPSWTVIIFATGACVFIGVSVWTVPAAVALIVAVAAVAFERFLHIAAIVCGCLSGLAFMHLPAFGFFGLPSVVAGTFTLLAIVISYRQTVGSTRRFLRFGAAMVFMALTTSLVVAGLATLDARADAERGVDAARAGLSAAADGDPDGVSREFAVADEAFAAARGKLTSNWLAPVALIPVASQNLRAVNEVVEQGGLIAQDAATAAAGLDVLSMKSGLGPDELAEISRIAPSLVDLVDRLERAEATLSRRDLDWVIAPVIASRDELAAEVDDVLPTARLSADAALYVPPLLGSEGVRRYFVAFGTPAESREFGGLLGSWALMTADAGHIEIVDSGRVSQLYDMARSSTIDPATVPQWYLETANPTQWPQNLTSSPNIDVVARSVNTIFQDAGGIDGFVYIDAWGVIDFLKLTGPIEVSWRIEPLDAENAVPYFFRDQYESLNRSITFEQLTEVLKFALVELTTGTLPGPEQLGAVLGASARGGHLQITTFDEGENGLLRSLHLQRKFGWPTGTADAMALVQTNGSASKLDLYLHRDVSVIADHAASGELDMAVSVQLSSDVPDDVPVAVLGPDGINQVMLSMYTPHTLFAVTVDGVPVEHSTVGEFGYLRHLVTIAVPADMTRVVRFELQGFVEPTESYDLSIWHQPLVNDDQMTVEYHGPTGDVTNETLTLTENAVFSASDDG